MTTTGYTPRRAVLNDRGEPVYLPGVPGLWRHRRAVAGDLAARRAEWASKSGLAASL